MVPKMQPGQKKVGLFFTGSHSHPFGVGLPAPLGAPAPGGPRWIPQSFPGASHRTLQAQAPALPSSGSSPVLLWGDFVGGHPDLFGPLFLQGHSGFCQNWGGVQNTLKCKVGDATKRPPPLWTPWGPSSLSFPPSRDSKTDGGGAPRPLGQQEEKGTDGGSGQKEAQRRGPGLPSRGGAELSNWPEAPAGSCGPLSLAKRRPSLPEV